jgi:hypothetical protein
MRLPKLFGALQYCNNSCRVAQPPHIPLLENTSFFYQQQCNLIGLHANGKYVSIKTHRQVVEVAQLLKSTATRQQVLEQLPGLLGNGNLEQHEQSVDLVSRLLVMVQLGDVPHEWSGSRSVRWVDGTLSSCMRSHFSPSPVLGHERVKFEKGFNALGLRKIAGIDIRWSSNLAEHLRLTNDDTVLCVFHHVSFLRLQLEK